MTEKIEKSCESPHPGMHQQPHERVNVPMMLSAGNARFAVAPEQCSIFSTRPNPQYTALHFALFTPLVPKISALSKLRCTSVRGCGRVGIGVDIGVGSWLGESWVLTFKMMVEFGAVGATKRSGKSEKKVQRPNKF